MPVKKITRTTEVHIPRMWLPWIDRRLEQLKLESYEQMMKQCIRVSAGVNAAAESSDDDLLNNRVDKRLATLREAMENRLMRGEAEQSPSIPETTGEAFTTVMVVVPRSWDATVKRSMEVHRCRTLARYYRDRFRNFCGIPQWVPDAHEAKQESRNLRRQDHEARSMFIDGKTPEEKG